jgi:hypothetical protein
MLAPLVRRNAKATPGRASPAASQARTWLPRQGDRLRRLTSACGAPRGIRTPNRQICSLVLCVDLVGSRRMWPAHVGCVVDPDGSRRVQSDRLDDQGMIKRPERRAPRPAGPPTGPILTMDRRASAVLLVTQTKCFAVGSRRHRHTLRANRYVLDSLLRRSRCHLPLNA